MNVPFTDGREMGDDPFGPPAGDLLVECWHCGSHYMASEMKYEARPHMDAFGSGPLWWCKMPDCDGAGFRHDIWPAVD